jgi:hypothetical protein
VHLFPSAVHNLVIGAAIDFPVPSLCGVWDQQVGGCIHINPSDLGIQDGRQAEFIGLEYVNSRRAALMRG